MSEQKHPEERSIQLNLKEYQTSCSFLIYRRSVGVLVIVTPHEEEPGGYFQSPELAATTACSLYNIDPRLLIWIEHRLIDGRNQYARVTFDRPITIGSDQPMDATFSFSHRTLVEEVEVREIQCGLGYMPESET